MTAIHWPAWVHLDGDEDNVPRANASPAPALVMPPGHRFLARAERDGSEPEGSVGWIGDAPVYVDDGRGPEATPPEQHGAPRARIVTPEQLAAELAQAKAVAVVRLTAEVESNVEARFTASQQRLLTAVYARAVGKAQANKRAKIEALVDWVEAQTLHLYTLAAQVHAATTIAEVEAVAFVPSQFPAPQHSARAVLQTEG